MDDIRSPHTPVAAAAWQAVLTTGLHPIAISTYKLYATFGDPEPFRQVLLDLAATGAVDHEVQLVNGETLVRVWQPRTIPVLPWRRWVPEVAWPAVSWTGGRALRASRRPQGRRAR